MARKTKHRSASPPAPSVPNLGFTVDTHIFRELGDLLVGRDSTAVAELIKNAYDADATIVTVAGTRLDDPESAAIVITDNGHGMTQDQFINGFLKIAGRQKELGGRRSPRFHRRFTGAKGIGRLAAHKLAKHLAIHSIAAGKPPTSIEATIDWGRIEESDSLDDAAGRGGIRLRETEPQAGARSGTEIRMSKLRRKWNEKERVRLYQELESIEPPQALLDLPEKIYAKPRLTQKIPWRDTERVGDTFRIRYEGDFQVGDAYWSSFLDQIAWLVEIDAFSKTGKMMYRITPSRAAIEKYPGARPSEYKFSSPEGEHPRFAARIIVREGSAGGDETARKWTDRTNGVRVFVEGFRVLPYGDSGNDWLGIDADYVQRQTARTVKIGDEHIEYSGLLLPPGRQVFGAVFMTQSASRPLRMLVNREGFVPDEHFDFVVRSLKNGIYLCTRDREEITAAKREEARQNRLRGKIKSVGEKALKLPEEARKTIELRLELSAALLASATRGLKNGDLSQARQSLQEAHSEISDAAITANALLPEVETLRMMAGIGLQINAFIHEIRAVHQAAVDVTRITEEFVHDNGQLEASVRKFLRRLLRQLGNLTRTLERNAAFLTDVLSADARRRRSRQSLKDRFESAVELFTPTIERLGIEVENRVASDVRSPPMFAAELAIVMTNLLSNAIKAAGKRGRIAVTASENEEQIIFLMQNTGVAVQLVDAERWFMPFASSIESPEPLLGHGMGMGLPITRDLIESYGGDIRFVKPATKGFRSAIEFRLPRDRS